MDQAVSRPRIQDQPQSIQDILQPPTVAWPTVLLFLFSSSLMLFGFFAGALGYWSTAQVFLATLITHYFLFTVVHETSHRSAIAGHDKINEWMGNVGAFLLIPLLTNANFRYVHMQHHLHTNEGGKLDPDDWAGSNHSWLLPFRWFTIHARYIYFYLLRIKSRPSKEVRGGLISLLLGQPLIAYFIFSGHFYEVFFYYLLPSNISFAFLAMAFDWLPHRPHDVAESKDPYRATSIRMGFNWILSPLLLWQNYHLMHHLYPRLPFYRYGRALKALEPELIAKNAHIIKGLW